MVVQETFINSKHSELKIQIFNDSKWTMKNIKMKVSWRQITFRFWLLVWLGWNTVSYVIYNIEGSEVALNFCQKLPSNLHFTMWEEKPWVHLHISYSHTVFCFSLVTLVSCAPEISVAIDSVMAIEGCTVLDGSSLYSCIFIVCVSLENQTISHILDARWPVRWYSLCNNLHNQVHWAALSRIFFSEIILL